MRTRILISLGIFCFLALTAGGCIGRQQKPLGFSGVTSYNGILYLGSTDGKVVAVNASTRNEEWSFGITAPSKGMSCGSSSASATIYGTPAVAGDSVCVGTYSGEVYAVNMATGKERWVYPPKDYIGAIVGSPVVADDTVYVCSSDGKVYALDVTYGHEKWKSDPLGDKLWTTPAVKEETVYVSTFDGHIYALSGKDGSVLPWCFEGEAGFASSPVLYENTIFAGSFDRNLYAVEIGDDDPLWKFPGGNWFWAAPVVRDGVVYAGCLDGKVYAVDAKTGDEKWVFDTTEFVGNKEDRIVSSPIVVGDSLVVATDSGNIYIVDIERRSGKRVRNPDDADRPTVDARIQGSLCTQDGIVYVRAQDNCLYTVDIGKEMISWRLPLVVK